MNDIDLLNVDLNLLKAFDALVERPALITRVPTPPG
jgi:hypothetical protein